MVALDLAVVVTGAGAGAAGVVGAVGVIASFGFNLMESLDRKSTRLNSSHT